MYYLIPADAPSFATLDDLTQHVRAQTIAPDLSLVVQGTAKRLVSRLELRPLDDDKPAAPKRDPEADAKARLAVLAHVRKVGAGSIADVAKALDLTTIEVSRHKAALLKEGKLAFSKKGTIQATADAA